MKASPEDQRLLLDVAEADRVAEHAEQRRRRPAQADRIGELTRIRQEQLRELTEKTGVLDDVRAELRRVEGDVELAVQRRIRDADRLTATSNPKDVQALEREIASLVARISGLEDVQLEVMDRVEEAERVVASQQRLVDGTTAEGVALTRAAKDEVAAATVEQESALAERAALAGRLPADLLAEYERRAQRATGAALLRRGMCEGCRMVLAGTDITAVRRAEDDDVVFCPECGCILVRTEESGL